METNMRNNYGDRRYKTRYICTSKTDHNRSDGVQ